jgi:hypothetical protein
MLPCFVASPTTTTVPLRAAYFNDAGLGLDDAGIARVKDLDTRGMPAETILCTSAEIGSAISSWNAGVISHVNNSARAEGLCKNRCLFYLVTSARGDRHERQSTDHTVDASGRRRHRVRDDMEIETAIGSSLGVFRHEGTRASLQAP